MFSVRASTVKSRPQEVKGVSSSNEIGLVGFLLSVSWKTWGYTRQNSSPKVQCQVERRVLLQCTTVGDKRVTLFHTGLVPAQAPLLL